MSGFYDHQHPFQPGPIRPCAVGFVCALLFTTTFAIAAQDEKSTQPVEFESTSKELISLVADPVSCALAPDGRTLATGDDQGSITLWDVATARPVQRLIGHADTVAALAFAPASTLLASAGYDGQVRTWDVGTGETVRTFTGHDARLTCIAWSPDGNHILSGGYDKTLRMWSIADEAAEPMIARDHTVTIRSVAFSPDGRRFASCDASGQLRVWDARTVTSLTTLDAEGVSVLAFLRDGRLCTSGRGGTVRLWADRTGDGPYAPAEGADQLPHDSATLIAISPDGTTIAVGDRRGGVRTADVASWQLTSFLQGHADEILGVAFFPDSRSLVTVSRDRSVRLWRAKHPATPRLAKLDVEKVRLWSLEVDREHSRIAAGGRKGFLATWDLVSGEKLRQYEGFTGTVDAIALTSDGAHLAACCWKEKTISIWNVDSAAVHQTLDAGVNVRCVRFSPDSRWLAAGCEDGAIRIWEWQSAAGDPRTVPSGPGSVYDLAFSPDGRVLAACGGDWTKSDPGFVTMWETGNWSELRRLTEHTRAVRTVRFTPDGSHLASAGEDGLIVLWHAETFVPVARLSNPGGVRPLTFSREGNRLAAGLHDGTINVWDLKQGEVVQRFRAEDDVFGLAFGSDESVLFSVSGETRMEIWPTAEPAEGNDGERIRHWNRSEE